jgi:hypothetical protein
MPRFLRVPWTLEGGERKPPDAVLYGLGLNVAIYTLVFLTKYGVLMNRPI